ncbi:NitT/TauT family transport system permease protein [Arboricoccus pini]|uniref:NitT/TauT family transport system permease protein n=1 Tax=Arboricoccus pini TaxID=1963835 RepID=A0A212RF00_9PROT|nr:ABC transporter permease [Arboricoccus pini]SNB70849.1 NitT/TauT family transport system permease protein [Arboricoccus pini]
MPEQTLRHAALSERRVLALAPARRRLIILILLAAGWEACARWYDNSLLLPSFTQTISALLAAILNGELPSRTGASLEVLLVGYAIGILLAVVITAVAALSRWGESFLVLLTSMFNPLPAIALLPIALLWFGVGSASLIFVVVHAVLWPLTLSCHAGFRAVPQTLRMAGRNLGLSGSRYVFDILFPAALPSILSGLRLGWAFAWRTLIAAEMVFGASAASGGIGWYIFVNRAQLETANVFAGLLAVILIGLLVEALVFSTLSRLTVQRWGQEA